MRFISPEFLFTLAPVSKIENPLSEGHRLNGKAAISGETLIEEPLSHGTLVLEDDGTIIEVLNYRPDRPDLEILSGAIGPGFINAHLHLELSHLKGLIPENTRLVGFIQSVQKSRMAERDIIQGSIEQAYREMIQEGIVGIGDISNSSDSFQVKSSHEIQSHTFLECFGFLPQRAGEVFDKARTLKKEAKEKGLRASISPHSPYSVSRELFDLIRSENETWTSIHNQESEEENLLYLNGSGDFNLLYKGFGMDISFFVPYQKRSLPVYYPWLGEGKKLFVHNTFSKKDDWEGLISKKDYPCLCPEANLYIEGVLPRLEIFQNHFGKIVIGTDSLASNHQLSILRELKTLQHYYPGISLNQLLVWACRNGAEFFEWENLGSLEKGKKPGIIHIQDQDSPTILNLNSTIRRIL